MEKKQRNISLDLYRILCMFLITTIHIVGYTDLTGAIPAHHFNGYLVGILSVLQRLAINGFTLISAYFLATTQTTLKKTVSFWLQLVFMSVCILLLSMLFVSPVLSLSALVKSFFPVLTNHYWYPVNYLILLLFVPFFNKAISALSKRQFEALLVLTVGLTSGFVHLNPFYDPAVYVGHESHSLLWFFVLYFLGAYVRQYGVRISRPVIWGVFILSGIILFGSIGLEGGVLSGIADRFPVIKTALNRLQLTHNNSIFALLLSVSSFVLFENWKLPASKPLSAVFSFLAPTVFGIYLIQEHHTIRKALWDFVNIPQWADSPWLFAMMIAVFLGLWAVSIGLYLFYRLMHKLFLRKLEAWLVKCCTRVTTSAKNRLA